MVKFHTLYGGSRNIFIKDKITLACAVTVLLSNLLLFEKREASISHNSAALLWQTVSKSTLPPPGPQEQKGDPHSIVLEVGGGGARDMSPSLENA